MEITQDIFNKMVEEEAVKNWKVKALLDQYGGYDTLPDNIKDMLHKRLGVAREDKPIFSVKDDYAKVKAARWSVAFGGTGTLEGDKQVLTNMGDYGVVTDGCFATGIMGNCGVGCEVFTTGECHEHGRDMILDYDMATNTDDLDLDDYDRLKKHYLSYEPRCRYENGRRT